MAARRKGDALFAAVSSLMVVKSKQTAGTDAVGVPLGVCDRCYCLSNPKSPEGAVKKATHADSSPTLTSGAFPECRASRDRIAQSQESTGARNPMCSLREPHCVWLLRASAYRASLPWGL